MMMFVADVVSVVGVVFVDVPIGGRWRLDGLREVPRRRLTEDFAQNTAPLERPQMRHRFGHRRAPHEPFDPIP